MKGSLSKYLKTRALKPSLAPIVSTSLQPYEWPQYYLYSFVGLLFLFVNQLVSDEII